MHHLLQPFFRQCPRPVLLGATAAALFASNAAAQAAVATPADGGAAWVTVQQALGGRGTMQPGDVLKFSFPRSDLQVTADGVAIKPPFALGSWVAFKRPTAGSNDAIVMGDLVLLEDEVSPVMSELQKNGVEQSALHNHLLHESPRVMYMHIMAHGDAAKIAMAIRSGLSLSKTPVPQGPATTASPAAAIDLDTAAVARALGYSGKVNGGVFQFSIARAEAIEEHGTVIPPSMGVATAINFQPTGGGKAAISGDFVMTGDEVNRVIRALRDSGISVAALHSHMLTETPHLFFMHFWANDDAVRLARGLRAGLDVTNSQKPR